MHSAYFILTTDKPMSNKMDVITQQTEQAISIKLKARFPEKKKILKIKLCNMSIVNNK